MITFQDLSNGLDKAQSLDETSAAQLMKSGGRVNVFGDNQGEVQSVITLLAKAGIKVQDKVEWAKSGRAFCRVNAPDPISMDKFASALSS